MTLRINILGFEVAKVTVDFDLCDTTPGQPPKATPVDKISDYFTRRFIKRKLLP